MYLPNADKAIIKREKITDYILNAEHFEGKHKARMFASVLGITDENADWLMREIKDAVLTNDVIEQSASSFGEKYTVDFDITFENKTASLRTAWIIEEVNNIPRFITCYIKLQL